MPTVIMPKMGDGMEEGTLLRWLKEIGDQVEEGDPIAEIETDKVSLEIEAGDSGLLTQTLVAEGATVPIGTPIAMIGEEADIAQGEATMAPQARAEGGEPAQAVAQQAEQQPSAASQAASTMTEPPSGDANPDAGAPRDVRSDAPASPSVGGANGAASPTTAETPSQPTARPSGERLRASPLVKRLAAEHGLDLSAVAGTGPGGRIVKDDVMPYVNGTKPMPTAAPQAAAEPGQPQPTQQPQAQPAQAAQPQPTAAGVSASRPTATAQEMSRIRRTTGKRMLESKQTIPHFYVTSEIDMEPATAFRSQVNAQVPDESSKVSFNDMIVKAAALALREYPNLNTTLEGDTLYGHSRIDVNVAVAIEGGLIAPFVVEADQKSLGAIARATKDLIGRARKGGLEPAEYQGGTFTISNLGMYDVEEFVAIVNPPQAAILAIGSITEVPVVKDGALAIGRRMKVTLSADHRVTDGAEVAQFLMLVKRYLENPMLLALS